MSYFSHKGIIIAIVENYLGIKQSYIGVTKAMNNIYNRDKLKLGSEKIDPFIFKGFEANDKLKQKTKKGNRLYWLEFKCKGMNDIEIIGRAKHIINSLIETQQEEIHPFDMTLGNRLIRGMEQALELVKREKGIKND